jgi:hypothetical protein
MNESDLKNVMQMESWMVDCTVICQDGQDRLHGLVSRNDDGMRRLRSIVCELSSTH